MAKPMKIHKGDKVKVIAGRDKGTVGEVIAVNAETNRVTVQGANLMKRHIPDRVHPQTGNQIPGGIVTSEAPIHVSNVALVVKVDGKEVTTRVGSERKDVTKRRTDGSEYPGTRGVRIARKTGKEI